jgi:hypothetical protein
VRQRARARNPPPDPQEQEQEWITAPDRRAYSSISKPTAIRGSTKCVATSSTFSPHRRGHPLSPPPGPPLSPPRSSRPPPHSRHKPTRTRTSVCTPPLVRGYVVSVRLEMARHPQPLPMLRPIPFPHPRPLPLARTPPGALERCTCVSPLLEFIRLFIVIVIVLFLLFLLLACRPGTAHCGCFVGRPHHVYRSASGALPALFATHAHTHTLSTSIHPAGNAVRAHHTQPVRRALPAACQNHFPPSSVPDARLVIPLRWMINSTSATSCRPIKPSSR